MRRMMLASLATMMLLGGCATTPVDQAAICDGTAASRRALAGALLTDGGPQAQRAGLLVLDQMRAGCDGYKPKPVA